MKDNIENIIENRHSFSHEDMVSKFSEMSHDEALEVIDMLDKAYESFEPLVSDDVYDHVFYSAFVESFPESPRLDAVRDATSFLSDGDLTPVKHSRPMLSTNKAYTSDEVTKWLDRIVATVGSHYAEDDIMISITPKLDGISGRYENNVLATRGTKVEGFDVTHVFQRGVIAYNGIAEGDGELVLSKSYFDNHMADIASHPRNVMGGIVSAKNLSEDAQKAVDGGAAYFLRYDEMERINLTISNFREMISNDVDIYDHCHEVLIENGGLDFPIDGFVMTVDNTDIREEMGHNSSYHFWMIAIKKKGEEKDAKVKSVTLQTGRTGRITPVIEIETTNLSGANISRVTGHNLRLLTENGIGEGAVIRIVRSGEVIPYVTKVIKPSTIPLDIKCSSCGSEVVRESESIYVCINANHCPAQMMNSVIHHFKTMEVKNFGPKAIEKIFNSQGKLSIDNIYWLTTDDYQEIGFGPRQAEILVESIQKLVGTPQEPEKFLAAFGIKGLGVRASKSLLDSFTLESLVSGEVSQSDIADLDNFGETSAKEIVLGLEKSKSIIKTLMAHISFIEKEAVSEDSPISGKNILFTGTMSQMSRKEMEAIATSLGAKVQKSISKKTDILVAGEKAGSKLEKAKSLNITVMNEDEYTQFIK